MNTVHSWVVESTWKKYLKLTYPNFVNDSHPQKINWMSFRCLPAVPILFNMIFLYYHFSGDENKIYVSVCVIFQCNLTQQVWVTDGRVTNSAERYLFVFVSRRKTITRPRFGKERWKNRSLSRPWPSWHCLYSIQTSRWPEFFVYNNWNFRKICIKPYWIPAAQHGASFRYSVTSELWFFFSFMLK